MTDAQGSVAKAVHEALSKANVMAYLDMPESTAEDVARAAIAAMPSDQERLVEFIIDNLVESITSEFKGFWEASDIVEELPVMVREAAAKFTRARQTGRAEG